MLSQFNFFLTFLITVTIKAIFADRAISMNEQTVSDPISNFQSEIQSEITIDPYDPNQFWFGIRNETSILTTLQDENLIEKVISWGAPWYLNQFSSDDDSSEMRNITSFLRPSLSQYNTNSPSMSAPQHFLLSCYNDQTLAIQKSLNEDCSKKPDCNVSYYMYSLWATTKGMNFSKDGVLARTCGILRVGGSSCDFPDGKSCEFEFYQDFTNDADFGVSGLTRIGKFDDICQISDLMMEFSEKTGQQLSFPKGVKCKK